ncbi:MAG TPA: hypothetical protein VMX55_03970 [candidate division Zixibacteria bacterium]|nr:hypothetical protein [candidate division Zixibacteria bacterium]
MNKTKIKIFSLSGLLILGGAFAFIYKRGILDFTSIPIVAIVAIVALLVAAITIGVAISSRKKLEQSQSTLPQIETDFSPIPKSRQDTCYFCDFPIENHAEFCSNCGNKITYCNVCKLPISFGDKVGMCDLCETKGHFSHLFEWVKINGSCPHCLQQIPSEAITEIS